MLLRRYEMFTGGIDLPEEKHATLESPIEPCQPVSRLFVPLPASGEPLVSIGQAVQAGEKIAASGTFATYAPLAGKVASITVASVANAGGFARCQAIELVELSTLQPPQAPRFKEWHEPEPIAMLETLLNCDEMVHRCGGQSLPEFVRAAINHRCRRLIANVIEDQPYVTADHRLLAEHGRAVLVGLAILGKAIDAAKIILAVDERRTGYYRRLHSPAKQHGIVRMALPPKYPMGADALLVNVLTGREAPIGGSTMDVGTAVIDAATCHAIFCLVATGQGPLGRVVTLSGPGMPRRGNFWVPYGALCSELAAVDRRLIHGGAMTGLLCPPDAVVSPGTDALLALDDTVDTGAPVACIRCAWCTDHCPSRLNVAALNDAFELGQLRRAMKLGAQACMECGVCSYICPSRLPLSQRVKSLKRVLGRPPHDQDELPTAGMPG